MLPGGGEKQGSTSSAQPVIAWSAGYIAIQAKPSRSQISRSKRYCHWRILITRSPIESLVLRLWQADDQAVEAVVDRDLAR